MAETEPVLSECSNCGATIRCEARHIGRSVKCPACGSAFVVERKVEDDEVVAEVAKAFAERASKAGGFLRRLAGKGAASGKKAITKKRRQTAFADDVRASLQRTGRILADQLVSKAEELELCAADIVDAVGIDIERYLNDSISRLKTPADIRDSYVAELRALFAFCRSGQKFA